MPSTANVDFSDFLEFTTEPENSKFENNWLKLDDNGLLELFNLLVYVPGRHFFYERVIEKNVEIGTWDEHRSQTGEAYGKLGRWGFLHFANV